MLPRQEAGTQKWQHDEKEATHNRAVKSERTRHKSERCSEAQKLNLAGKDILSKDSADWTYKSVFPFELL